MTVRRRRAGAGPLDALAASLPDELRSFDDWYRPGGLLAYMAALSEFIGGGYRVSPVMNAAGLSAAGWFWHMLKEDRCEN